MPTKAAPRKSLKQRTTAKPKKMIAESKPERKTTPPLEKTQWALKNLMNAYQYHNMQDPSFTKKEWAAKAGIASASMLGRFVEQKSISLDNAVRLADALDLTIDQVMMPPEEFLLETYDVHIADFEKRFA